MVDITKDDPQSMADTGDTIRVSAIDREGVTHDIEAPTDMGLNLMEVLKASGLPVEGTCGGMALCASCHCHIKSDHLLPEPSDAELDMLDQAPGVTDDSRLACQIKVSGEIDGLVIQLARES